MLSVITPLVLTYNEAPNIRRTLEKLGWAQNILVLDSFSTDETIEIVRSFPQTRLMQRPFDSFAQQCNFGLAQITTEWVLSLDADYVLSDELIDEIGILKPASSVTGYTARFKYSVYGHSLRGSLYPPRAVLFRKDRCQYVQDGHAHRLLMSGQSLRLEGLIEHDDRKSLSQWFRAQDRYNKLEAAKLAGTPLGELNLPDRLRHKMIVAPFLVFFFTLLVKGLILDGWPGWFYVVQRTIAELMLSLRLVEAKLEPQNRDS